MISSRRRSYIFLWCVKETCLHAEQKAGKVKIGLTDAEDMKKKKEAIKD